MENQKISFVYILQSIKDNKFYVGYTTNLKNRLKRHKQGEVKATKYRKPLRLVYYEECESRYEGRKREKYLKSLYGYREKRKLIKEFDKKVKF